MEVSAVAGSLKQKCIDQASRLCLPHAASCSQSCRCMVRTWLGRRASAGKMSAESNAIGGNLAGLFVQEVCLESRSIRTGGTGEPGRGGVACSPIMEFM